MIRVYFVVLVLLCASIAGCQQKSEISGTITYNGTPVEIGYMTLHPQNKGHAFSAPVSSGRYKIAEIQPGKYTAIAIGTRKLNHYSTSAEAAAAAAKEAGHVSEVADYIAQDADGNNKELEVGNGEQTFDMAITGPAIPATKAP